MYVQEKYECMREFPAKMEGRNENIGEDEDYGWHEGIN